MTSTFWDSFETLLLEAESEFLENRYEQAVEKWQNYYRITAKTEYSQFLDEIEKIRSRQFLENTTSLPGLYSFFIELRGQYLAKHISHYTFTLYTRLIVRTYRANFRKTQKNMISLEYGVMEDLSGNYQEAVQILTAYLEQKTDSVPARSFLGHAYIHLNNQKAAIECLTGNLFLAADELTDQDLYLSQFKLLYGKLYSESGDRKVAGWRLTFESWYRNYLSITENHKFFVLMQQKESSERIVQVKYFTSERYRHFVRCLFIAEYVRLYLKNKTGLIEDQEKYMQKLDVQLFERYRKKRKPLITEN